MQPKLSRTRNKSPDSEPLALSIPHAITRLFREQNRLHGRAAQELGLSAEQAHLLLVLWSRGAPRGSMTMTELGREVALSSGTLSTAIDRMEVAGLVRRVPDEADGRAMRVEPAGWPPAQRKKLVDALVATESAMLGPLDAAERATLLSLLTRVLDGLEPTLGRRGKRPRA